MTTHPQVQPDHPDLLTTGQACSDLDVHRTTLLRWVARGIARPAMRLPGPGACLFSPAEVEWLRARRGERKQMPRGVGASAVAS